MPLRRASPARSSSASTRLPTPSPAPPTTRCGSPARGALPHWGLAYPQGSKKGTHAALLASLGTTGSAEVFEGNNGFKDTIAGDVTIDWSSEDLEQVRRTIVKKHNAEIHSQTAVDAAIAIAGKSGFDPKAIRAVPVTTLQVAFDVIVGGQERDEREVWTKKDADHSLPCLVAVALLDRQVQPAQVAPARIVAADVQRLLAQVQVRTDAAHSKRFPAELPSRVEVELADGTVLADTRAAYDGFHTDPLDWTAAVEKFNALSTPFAGHVLAEQLAVVISDLDQRPVAALTDLLAEVPSVRGGARPATIVTARAIGHARARPGHRKGKVTTKG